MKITKEQLRKVIQEELENVMHEVSMDDLTDLNDPDRDSKLSGEKLTQEKLKNLFQAIKNLSGRISKLEGSKSSGMSKLDNPRYKG